MWVLLLPCLLLKFLKKKLFINKSPGLYGRDFLCIVQHLYLFGYKEVSLKKKAAGHEGFVIP
jgi:hypothetical protein